MQIKLRDTKVSLFTAKKQTQEIKRKVDILCKMIYNIIINLFRLFLNLGYIEDNKTYERVFFSDDFKQMMFAPKKSPKFYDDIVKTSIRLIKANTGYDIQYSIFKDGNTNKITRISFLVTPHCFRGF